MLRRRFLAGTIRLMRVYTKATSKLFNRIKASAISVLSLLVEARHKTTTCTKVESHPYYVSQSDIDVSAATNPDFEPEKYNVVLPYSDSQSLAEKFFNATDYVSSVAEFGASVIFQEDIDPSVFDSSVAQSKKKQSLLVCSGGFAAGEAKGISKKTVKIESITDGKECTAAVAVSTKIIEIDSLVKALSGDSEQLCIKRILNTESVAVPLAGDVYFSELNVFTTTSPDIDACVVNPIDANLDVCAAMNPSVSADLSDGSNAQLDSHAAETTFAEPNLVNANSALLKNKNADMFICADCESVDAANASASKEITMITAFTPFASGGNERIVKFIEGSLTELIPEDFDKATTLPSYSLYYPALYTPLCNIIKVTLPDTLKIINANTLSFGCIDIYSGKTIHIVFPEGLTTINGNIGYLSSSGNKHIYDFSKSKSIPSLNTVTIDGAEHSGKLWYPSEIRVPASLYSSWKTMSGWKDMEGIDKLVAV